MDAREALKAASAETAEVVARIDAKVREKLLKRARRHRMDEGEVIAQLEMWKLAAKKMKRLHLGHGRHKGH